MDHFLIYFKNYWDAMKGPYALVNEWGTKTTRFHQIVKPRDTLWVIIQAGPSAPDEWRLLQKIQIESLYRDPANEYSYRARGDEKASSIFDPKVQSDLVPLLKRLNFASGKKIELSGRKIAKALQFIRKLCEEDTALLSKYATSLARIT